MLDYTEGEAMEVLTGVIASDGGVYEKKHSVIKCPYFQMSLSGAAHDDWLLEIKKALTVLGVEVSSNYPRAYDYISSYGKPYVYNALLSRAHPLMGSLRALWYPDGKKEIPEDFKLSPVSLAHMFMGDGCSSYGGIRNISALIYTQGFSEGSIERIERALWDMGIEHTGRKYAKLKSKKSGSGITITLLQDSVDDFMTIVKPHMVPSFMYKVKYRGPRC